MDQKFFLKSFAFSGDKAAVPDALQPSGTISFDQGFPFDYQRELGVDPAAKAIPRQEMNYLLNAITDNIGTWQRYMYPEWITSANNGGAAFPYPRGSIVRYRATGGDPFQYFISRVDNNTVTPTAGVNWAPLVFEVATSAQAVAGTDDATIMTPAKVAAYVGSLSLSIPDATETVKGKVELATNAETVTGTDATRATHPAGVAAALAAYVPAASTTVVGKTRLATTAEATTGALATVAVTPAGLKTVADSKANLSGAIFTGDLALSKNSPAIVLTSPDGTKEYRLLGNVSNAVDGGFLVQRWTGAAFSTIASFVSTGLDVTGAVTATSGFGPPSSRFLKDFSDAPLGYSLETFERIDVRRGKYKSEFNNDGRERLFFDAEQLAEVIPEAELPNAATVDGKSYPGVDHSQLIPAMVAALAEASREIRALQARIALLEG